MPKFTYGLGAAARRARAVPNGNGWQGCGSDQISYLGANVSSPCLRDVVGNAKRGMQFTTVGGFDLNCIEVDIGRLNTPTGDIWIEVYDTSGGLPNNLLGTSDKIDVTTIAATSGNCTECSNTDFEFHTPITLAGTTMYAWALCGDFAINAAHNVRICSYWIGLHPDEPVFYNSDTTTWSAGSGNTYDHYFITKGD